MGRKNAGIQAQAAERALQTMSGFVRAPAADFLRGYIDPPGAPEALIEQRLAEVEQAIAARGVSNQLPSLFSTKGSPADIEAVARALGWNGP